VIALASPEPSVWLLSAAPPDWPSTSTGRPATGRRPSTTAIACQVIFVERSSTIECTNHHPTPRTHTKKLNW
jgi:hypothetical protein